MTPRRTSPPPSPLHATLVGMAGLAAAMGIGRFAFTPLMPLMQHDQGLSLAQGGWLAGANYLGYLLGALGCFVLDPRPRRAALLGLLLVALTTLGMGATGSLEAWMLLRGLAGVASALVFVGVSAWTLAVLPPAERAARAGWIYAGVGLGMALAGMIAMAMATAGHGSVAGWWVLGGLAVLAALGTGRPLSAGTPAAVPVPKPAAASTVASPGRPAVAEAPAGATASRGEALRLVTCYGALGFGYIVPATFLPAMARTLIDDPRVFGWMWPVFGLAAAASTVLAATTLRRVPPRRLWAAGQCVMAVGVLAPLLHGGLAALVVSALCVGGTFMVVTMAGMQEARALGGPAAPRWMAAMTAAFATGQLIGPLLVRGASAGRDAISLPSIAAAVLLLVSSAMLLLPRPSRGQPSSPKKEVLP